MSDVKLVKILGIDATPDIQGSTSVTPEGADEILIADTSDSGTVKKATLTDVAALAGDPDINGKSSATVASNDEVLIADVDDSNNLKKVTAQSIADLAATSMPGNPAGTDWIVGHTDFTSNNIFTSGTEIQLGPYLLDMSYSGTGATNFHSNNIIDDESFGVRVFTLGSSASAFMGLGTDVEAFKSGDGTIRVGARIKYEDIPVSGGEDYYHFIGLNSKSTNLESTNYAVIGVNLSDNATNFVVKTHGGSGGNVTDTGVAVTSDTWFNLEIEINATSVSAWIDGSNVLNASTSNVPVSAVDLNPTIFTSFRIGSPSAVRHIYYDWAYIGYKPGTARGSLGAGNPWA